MNLRAEDLGRDLDRRLLPLYTVTGDEHLLAMEAKDLIRHTAAGRGFAERELHVVEAGFDWQIILQSADAPSLFASQRLLEIHIPSGKPGTEGAKALEKYCRRLPDDAVTLVLLPKVDRKAKWFKVLQESGVVVEALPLGREKLPGWVRDRLARQGQTISPEGARFIAERVEGNLLAADQEIRKLGLLFPPQALSFDDVRRSVGDVSRFDLFDLTDAALAGDSLRTLRIFDHLRGEGVEPPLILWAISRDLRTLAKAADAVRRGSSVGDALKREGVWSSRQPLLRRALESRLDHATLAFLLGGLARLDRMFKGLEKGDIDRELRLLVAHLALGRPVLLGESA